MKDEMKAGCEEILEKNKKQWNINHQSKEERSFPKKRKKWWKDCKKRKRRKNYKKRER